MSARYGKTTLDFDRLVNEQKITQAEADRLFDLREPSHGASTLISVLYIIGAIAAAAGVVLLKPTATTGLVLALICLIAGQFIQWKKFEGLDILALALGLGANAGLIGWFVMEYGETLSSLAVNGFAAAITLAMALLFRSRFLTAFVPITIGALIGSGAVYWYASYGIFVREGAITVVVFSLLAAGLWWISSKVRHADWQPMSLIAARVSFIMANFGFWVGSLWGDYVGEYFAAASLDRTSDYAARKAAETAFRTEALHIHEHVFTIGWVIFAIAAIALGKKLHNRFLEICGVVFLAINAFTQYFEFFQDEPWALIFGGIALVAIALALVRWQMRVAKQAT